MQTIIYNENMEVYLNEMIFHYKVLTMQVKAYHIIFFLV